MSPENNYNKQAKNFFQNHLLVLHTLEVFCNLTYRNHWTWTGKILDYHTELGLIL